MTILAHLFDIALYEPLTVVTILIALAGVFYQGALTLDLRRTEQIVRRLGITDGRLLIAQRGQCSSYANLFVFVGNAMGHALLLLYTPATRPEWLIVGLRWLFLAMLVAMLVNSVHATRDRRLLLNGKGRNGNGGNKAAT